MISVSRKHSSMSTSRGETISSESRTKSTRAPSKTAATTTGMTQIAHQGMVSTISDPNVVAIVAGATKDVAHGRDEVDGRIEEHVETRHMRFLSQNPRRVRAW